MKPLTISELELLAEDLRTLVGGRVQKATGSKSEYGISLWKVGRIHWLWIILDKKLPLLFLLDSPLPIKKTSTPCLLFLNAHLENKILQNVHFPRDLGRILELEFSDNVELQIRLFPHGCNLVVSTERSQVSWTKVQDMSSLAGDPKENSEVRTPGQVFKEWLALGSKESPLDVDAWRKREKEKIQKALYKLDHDITEKKDLNWRKAGEWLKIHGTLAVPEDLSRFVDRELSLSRNIQECFAKAKALEEKLIRSEQRRVELLAHLVRVETMVPAKKPRAEKKLKVKMEFRTLHLSEEICAYVGKSAQDNLKLLRAAKPWDLWLHVKDFPSAHGIISHPKNKPISDEQIRKCAQWLLKESLGKRFDASGVYDFLVTECRYVTPIRGDKIGRVTYKNERVLRIRSDVQK